MEQTWFTGRFDPPAEVASRNLPRLSGEGSVVTRPDGLVVRGRAYMASDPRRTRLLVSFALFAILVAGLLAGEHATAVVGTGLGALGAWAVRHVWRDRRGRPVDAVVPWEHVDGVDAQEALVVVVLGDARFLGTPVPNPVFFTPDGGPRELVDEVLRGMETAAP